MQEKDLTLHQEPACQVPVLPFQRCPRDSPINYGGELYHAKIKYKLQFENSREQKIFRKRLRNRKTCVIDRDIEKS